MYLEKSDADLNNGLVWFWYSDRVYFTVIYNFPFFGFYGVVTLFRVIKVIELWSSKCHIQKFKLLINYNLVFTVHLKYKLLKLNKVPKLI